MDTNRTKRTLAAIALLATVSGGTASASSPADHVVPSPEIPLDNLPTWGLPPVALPHDLHLDNLPTWGVPAAPLPVE